ncbi:MAG: putative BUG-like extracytoplasmic solute binding receptor,TTT family [Ramlibacter sp.]|jgi:tripartite-type tricarboxylate transporter receptor subunit TctC|nr:putative BUG-like extracytoplasmic solute binding receptor,TTT family [Ramlibacter sp.]
MKQFLKLAAVGLALAFGPVAHAAYPDKPIRLIVPWAAGGSSDAIARAVAQRMSETMGQSVIVDNRAGASGQIGTDAAAKSAPDGYTIAIVELPHAIAPALFHKLPYDLLRDFAPITMVGTSPLVLFVASTNYKNGEIKEFLKNTRAKDGPVSLAHSGAGSVSHLTAELLGSKNRMKVLTIPYKGSAPALIDVAAGTVEGHFSTLASGSPLLSAGKVSALMVAGDSRIAALPGVPTAREAGIEGIQVDQWWGLVAPATTPIPILEKLRQEAAAAMAHAAVRERLNALAVDLKPSSRDEFRSFMRAEVQRWGAVVREANVQLD